MFDENVRRPPTTSGAPHEVSVLQEEHTKQRKGSAVGRVCHVCLCVDGLPLWHSRGNERRLRRGEDRTARLFFAECVPNIGRTNNCLVL